jgi:transposase
MGAAQPHHVWLFANRRGNRLKVLLRDGHGIWLAQRWLHQGRFHWQDGEAAVTLTLQ